jgi:GTPase Era involved in 16S rRNA processing
MERTKKHVLLLGKPGTGKSTLLNAAIGSSVFKTGGGHRSIT